MICKSVFDDAHWEFDEEYIAKLTEKNIQNYEWFDYYDIFSPISPVSKLKNQILFFSPAVEYCKKNENALIVINQLVRFIKSNHTKIFHYGCFNQIKLSVYDLLFFLTKDFTLIQVPHLPSIYYPNHSEEVWEIISSLSVFESTFFVRDFLQYLIAIDENQVKASWFLELAKNYKENKNQYISDLEDYLCDLNVIQQAEVVLWINIYEEYMKHPYWVQIREVLNL